MNDWLDLKKTKRVCWPMFLQTFPVIFAHYKWGLWIGWLRASAVVGIVGLAFLFLLVIEAPERNFKPNKRS